MPGPELVALFPASWSPLFTGRGLSVEDTASRLIMMAERSLWADW